MVGSETENKWNRETTNMITLYNARLRDPQKYD